MKTHTDKVPKEISEDKAYLTEQLQIIQTACRNYDDRAIFAAFDRLKEKQWKPKTAAAIEEIRDMLFLDSNFVKTAELARALAVVAAWK